ncbi:hypothetical protein VPH35_008024 [Triticum aestivum]
MSRPCSGLGPWYLSDADKRRAPRVVQSGPSFLCTAGPGGLPGKLCTGLGLVISRIWCVSHEFLSPSWWAKSKVSSKNSTGVGAASCSGWRCSWRISERRRRRRWTLERSHRQRVQRRASRRLFWARAVTLCPIRP